MHPTTPTRTDRPLRAALYARVSTDTQTTDNQLLELRAYAARQEWSGEEYIDQVWRLDRFGRSLRHIVTALDELQVRGLYARAQRSGD
jgi:DNA invertase Pin-like site-specific DNA recombinase